MQQTATAFDVLGVPQRFALDPALVEQNYLARSRELHPDYHHHRPAAEQRASMELTAALNEAYQTLRDPFRRADYLLTLEGGPTASESREMAPAFLEEMLELRMRIEELREGKDAAGLETLERELKARRQGLVEEVARAFERAEQAPADARQRHLREVRQWLNTARYIQGLLRDLRAD